MKNSTYHVLPEKIEYKTVTLSESEIKSVQASLQGQFEFFGIFIGAIIAVFGYFIFGFFISLILALVGASTAMYFISSYTRNKKIEEIKLKKTAEANEKEIKRVNSNAEYLTSSLTTTYNSSVNLSKKVHNCLKEAGGWLRTAENEYKDNAFAPFWDAVEQAARWLGTYNEKTNEISDKANDYYKQLNRRQHTFPVFPVTIENIPDATFIVNELHRITRLGQTNFHFANIWEHRRTRKEIVSGFRNLNDAIINLGYTIEDSISNLQHSISSDMARIVDEQIKTRDSVEATRQSIEKNRESVEKGRQSIEKTRRAVEEKGAKIDNRLLEQNRMLDNIQHEREPGIFDIPKKH